VPLRKLLGEYAAGNHGQRQTQLCNKLKCYQQCCGSGMFIPDPDFYPSRILDPKTAIKGSGEKKLAVIPFFVAMNFTKFKKFYFCNTEEKNLDQFSKNYRTFYPKNCH
jgi:hypothetical protein